MTSQEMAEQVFNIQKGIMSNTVYVFDTVDPMKPLLNQGYVRHYSNSMKRILRWSGVDAFTFTEDGKTEYFLSLPDSIEYPFPEVLQQAVRSKTFSTAPSYRYYPLLSKPGMYSLQFLHPIRELSRLTMEWRLPNPYTRVHAVIKGLDYDY